MKIAALIGQAIVAALTFTAFVKLPEGSYTYVWVPFVVLFTSVVTIVAVIRPFGSMGRWLLIALNCVFLLLSIVAITGLAFFPLIPRDQSISWAVLAVLVFALPYCFSILALYRQAVAQVASPNHAA